MLMVGGSQSRYTQAEKHFRQVAPPSMEVHNVLHVILSRTGFKIHPDHQTTQVEIRKELWGSNNVLQVRAGLR